MALTLLAVVLLLAVMAVAIVAAWRAFGTGPSLRHATMPGHVFLIFFIASTALGSIILPITGNGSLAGTALVAFGLVAYAAGAVVAARRFGIPAPPGPPAEVGRINVAAVILLALVGLAAYASIAMPAGIPFLSDNPQGVRASFSGLAFDVFRWLTPPAALVAVAIALARGGGRSWMIAIGATAAVVGLLFLTASRALPFELGTGILLLALWSGRRVSRNAWLVLGAAALVFFVGVQLLRVGSEGGFRDLPDVAQFVVARTLDRVALIQARAVDVVATMIPSEHPFYDGSTYVRWLGTLRGEPPAQALGYWIYEQLYPAQPGGFATPGILGELWANGGAILVALGMSLFGAFVQALGHLVARLDRGAADRVFAALLVVAVARTYATSLNGFLLTLAVIVAWRVAVTLPGLPSWLTMRRRTPGAAVRADRGKRQAVALYERPIRARPTCRRGRG